MTSLREPPRAPGSRLVLDASVALEWLIPEREVQDEYAMRVLRLASFGFLVPPIWYLEIGNILAREELRGKLTAARIESGISRLESMDIACDAHSADRDFGPVLYLARSHRLTAYDASYLELAARAGLPLATLDQELRRAAAAAGVPLFNPA